MSAEALPEDSPSVQEWKKRFRLSHLVSVVDEATKGTRKLNCTQLYKAVRRSPVAQEIIALGGGERKLIQLFCRACRRTDFFQRRNSSDDDECSYRAPLVTKLLVRNRAFLQHCSGEFVPSLDVAFLLDLTKDSNKPRALARNLFAIISSVLQQWYPLRFHFAVVGYRDFDCDVKDRLVIQPFTSQIWPLRKWLQEATGFGGADSADDVLGGMAELAKLHWTADSRVVIHVGSSPCHGADYHAPECSDHYPEGDPTGLDPETILQSLKSLNIAYTFLRLSWRTDIMIKKFNEISEHYVDSLQLRMKSYSATVSSILHSSLEEQALARSLAAADLKDEEEEEMEDFSYLFSDFQLNEEGLWG